MKLKHYLIASEHNSYRPWITSPSALACFCLLVWGIRLIVPTSFTFAQNSIDAGDIMQRINDERTQRFIPALNINSKLSSAAAAKSNDMLDRGYFAHVDPDGKYVWPRIVAAGYSPYLRLGENLAMDFFSASAVVSAWMNSPTHRANIINDKFEDQGLASIYGNYAPDHDTIAITSLFGSLAKKSATSVPPVAGTTTKPAPAPAPKPSPTPKPVAVAPAPTPVPVTIPQPDPKPILSPDAGKPVGDRHESSSVETGATPVAPEEIPVSSEVSFIKLLRIIFSIFALVYVIFLVIDSVLIHKAKIKRDGMHSSPHTLLFLLIAVVQLIAVYA